MLLTAHLKPLSKTRKEPPAINSTICLASWKTASKEFPLTQITTFSLNISRKEGLIVSPGTAYHISPPKEECPLKNFCWYLVPNHLQLRKSNIPTQRSPRETQCLSLIPVAVALILHMKLRGTFLALTLQISEAALQI